MHADIENEFRPLLAAHRSQTLSTTYVTDPFQTVPDLPRYNRAAYDMIVEHVQELRELRGKEKKTRAVLVLGEAGTGKTHLLMRIANHPELGVNVLFVPIPLDEYTIKLHIWRSMLDSLNRPSIRFPKWTQLEELIAHAFSAVIRQVAERDPDAAEVPRWSREVTKDPFALFTLLDGQSGDNRDRNLRRLRETLLRAMRTNFPNIDENTLRALIDTIIYRDERRRRICATWLYGEHIGEDSQAVDLPPEWTNEDESNESRTRRREDIAFSAIRTLAYLSTFYQPMILAFDQIEGMRDKPELTRRWGSTAQEIIDYVPNLVWVACVFPSRWEGWFLPTFEESNDGGILDRLAVNPVRLDTFKLEYARPILEANLESLVREYKLPSRIYPFEPADLERLAKESKTLRNFITKSRDAFRQWLADVPPPVPVAQIIDDYLEKFATEEAKEYASNAPSEETVLGRMKWFLERMIADVAPEAKFHKLTHKGVLPEHFLLSRTAEAAPVLCVAVLNKPGNPFTARMQNLLEQLTAKASPFICVLIRDHRSSVPGSVGQQALDLFTNARGHHYPLRDEGWKALSAGYRVFVAIDQEDIEYGNGPVTVNEARECFRNSSRFKKDLFRKIAQRANWIAEALGFTPVES